MLTLSGVRKRLGGGRSSVLAVDGLSIELRGGEVFGLLGPNGAGKSTTISMMAGLIEPDEGGAWVELDGVGRWRAGSIEGRRRIGLCPQSEALYGRLSGAENLRLFGALAGLGLRAASERAGELLGLVGLTERAGRRVETYSGGMRRRLNIAAALVHDPAIVLLDEPTAGVDPHSRVAIFDLVRGLRERGCCVVYSTHIMEEAQRLCDRVGIMDRGRMLASGTVEGLIERHGGVTTVHIERAGGVQRVEGRSPVEVVGGLDLRATGEGRILGLRVEPPDLEGVFLRLTGRSLRDGGEGA